MKGLVRALALAIAALTLATAVSAVEIIGEFTVKEHKLTVLSGHSVPAGAALLWDFDSPGLSGIEIGNQLILTGKPGSYAIKLTTISVDKDFKITVERARATIEIEAVTPPLPPAPPKPPITANPVAARLKIVFGNAGCTATVIYPQRPDGRWDVFTAAHCIGAVGRKGRGTLPDGRSLPLTVVVRETASDIAWCVTDTPFDNLPYAILAKEAPAPGTPIWHMGYGVNVPGNKETGSVISGPNSAGELLYRIALSSGDSGSGIFREDNGECVATVFGFKGSTSIGGSSVRAWQLRPTGVTHHQIETMSEWYDLGWRKKESDGKWYKTDAIDQPSAKLGRK